MGGTFFSIPITQILLVEITWENMPMEDLEEKYTHREVGVKSGTTIFKRRFVAVYKWWLEVTCRDWTHTEKSELITG